MDSDAIVHQYKAFNDAERRKVLLAEYRCAKGCLLLHVWNSPIGAVYYRPAVLISASMSRRTGCTEVGRIPATAGRLAELSSAPWVWGAEENSVLIGCQHCVAIRFPASTIKSDAEAATPGSPVKIDDFWAAPNPPR